LHRRTWSAIAIGGALGAILGLAVVALAAGRVFGDGVQAIVFDETTGATRATFLVSQAGMYTLIAVAGAFGGAIIAGVGYAVGTLAGDTGERFSLTPLAIVGAFIGAVIGFASARTAIGVGGTITADGIVSLSVFRAAMVGLISGGTTGVVVAGTVERVGRTEAVGLEGPAWPSNPIAFARDALAAMGLPALAVVVGLGTVFALSQILLESDKTVALVIFGGVAALVLFGAAVIASSPGRHGGDPGD
jgi:hypothetical protein